MSIVPTTLRLATAICWSGWTRAALRSSRLFEDGLRLGQEVDLAEADRIEPVLPRLDDRREVLVEARDRGDELGDRGREGAGDEDQDHQQDRDDGRVDEDRGDDPRQARDERADPGDDRADDEREEPGQEEREEDVAEVEEDRGELADDDEQEGQGAKDEDGVDQATVPWLALVVEHGQRKPIFSRTSSIVASAIGRMRSAPASRMPSTSAGWAISSV